MNDFSGAEAARDLDALIIGAGFSGMYALHRFRELGLRVRAYERGNDVGGTWYWNRYPGLKCDTESIAYSYTFSREIYEGWSWSRRFAPQAEVERYAHYIADTLDLRGDIVFGRSVEHAVFDENHNRWTVHLDDGSQVTTKYLITGTGPLSTANVPDIPGLDEFRGDWYHTGRWPHENPPDFTDKRVAVVGTGSSGVQFVIATAPVAQRLTVFQRTPQYVTPATDRPLSAEYTAGIKADFDSFTEQMRESSFGAPGVKTDRSAHEDTPEERNRVFQQAWEAGAQAFALATYRDLNTDEDANAMAAEFVREKIREIVAAPATAEALQPDYLFGTKRPIKADGYYETFNRTNVDLVDTRSDPIVSITGTGIQTEHGHHEVDAIVFATGFDAITGTLFGIDIRGRNGITLRERWDDGARIETHLGLATSGFPNLLMISGPQSPSVLANFIFGIEQHVDWMVGLVSWLEEHSIEAFEAEDEAIARWTTYCQELADQTLLPRTRSWWTGGNVDGKPVAGNFPVFVGGVQVFAGKLADEAAARYPGFSLTTKSIPAVRS